MISTEDIKRNLERVEERIQRAVNKAGRARKDLQLVVVSKKKSSEIVSAAIDAGINLFAENYPEEGRDKIVRFSDQTEICWHMIGHIQSRKAKIVAQYYDFVHSVDSLKIANRLNRYLLEIDKVLPVLLEFNVSGESSKFGWNASEEDEWEQFLPIVSEIQTLSNLNLRGLMTMAPYSKHAKESQTHFAKLNKMREYFLAQLPIVKLPHLSMGMSADYQEGILEGATLIRVGSAILGARD